jgi:hypothetical protein
MTAQTDFRPQLHGFDFKNSWDTDDNYRSFIRQKVQDAVPIIAKAIATNPGIGAALASALGIAYGIGEALLPGLFDSIVIPIVTNQIVNAVNDKIANGLPDSYGACGGMAFAPLDYYYNQWPIPKGIYANGEFNVPPVSVPEAKQLRDYIYGRFEDSWDAGGVLNKMLEWYIVLKTIPPTFGGGGEEIQNRTEREWAALVGWLDKGNPRPISLLFDDWNIFDNHQVVAYGYGGDPSNGTAYINIYDNNNPNLELAISFDFMGSEMNGIIVDADNNRISEPYSEYLKGFFCTDYTPKTPPVSWGLQQGLTVLPGSCLSSKETFTLTYTVKNGFQFFQDPNNGTSTRLIPVVTDLLSATIIPSGYMNGGGVDAYSNNVLSFGGSTSYPQPGQYPVFAKAWMVVRDRDNAVQVDRDGQPLARLVFLGQLVQSTQPTLNLKVLDRLQIVAVNRTGSTCFEPFFEGANVTLMVRSQPFGAASLQYQWTVNGATAGSTTGQSVEIFNLPAAGSAVDVTVAITNEQTGCIASGDIMISVLSAEAAGNEVAFCKLRQAIDTLRVQGIIDPFGPDDPEYVALLLKNVGAIRRVANQISDLASGIIEANDG